MTAIGIGSAPNSYFMRKAARAGRGSFTYIGNISEVQQKTSVLLEKLKSPALVNIDLKIQGVEVEVAGLDEPLGLLLEHQPGHAEAAHQLRIRRHGDFSAGLRGKCEGYGRVLGDAPLKGNMLSDDPVAHHAVEVVGHNGEYDTLIYLIGGQIKHIKTKK